MTYCIQKRVDALKRNAAERYNLSEDEIHAGHIALQAMLEDPDGVSQIDCATDQQETNRSVVKRTCRLASAMSHFGLKPGDPVIIMGYNHLNLSIPFFACHFGGYPICGVDPVYGESDLTKLFPYIHPKMIFCQKSCEEKIKKALKANRLLSKVVIFDDKEADIEEFVKSYNGTQVHYRPAEFDQSKINGWLMLTSGTTGVPKVTLIPFDTLLNAIISWWIPVTDKKEERCLVMSTLQWMSSFLLFLSAPLKGYTRIQTSDPLTPQSFAAIVNKYRPTSTVWTPYLLGQFLVAIEKVCDLSCLKYVVIGGSAIEKPLLERFRKNCDAFLYVVYGMTELLVPIFDYDNDTPFGSAGKPQLKYEFRLMDDNGQPLTKPNLIGELWVKGNAFFKGYMNNPEETRLILTEDGWFKTGDMFYRDEQNYYYFIERKRLLIKHYGNLFSPLHMEDIIKQHPGVADACAVGLPDPNCLEKPVIAILRKNGDSVEPRAIIELLKKNYEGKRIEPVVFFLDSFPVTPSGKVHRAKVKEIAFTAKAIHS